MREVWPLLVGIELVWDGVGGRSEGLGGNCQGSASRVYPRSLIAKTKVKSIFYFTNQLQFFFNQRIIDALVYAKSVTLKYYLLWLYERSVSSPSILDRKVSLVIPSNILYSVAVLKSDTIILTTWCRVSKREQRTKNKEQRTTFTRSDSHQCLFHRQAPG